MVTPKIGFLFPGQGAQYPGMGKGAFQTSERARSLFQKADQILGYPLSQICFEGPDEKLAQTLYAQPALYLTSLALFRFLQDQFPELKPAFVAGLSLGEFAALTVAEALSFEGGLQLVQARAEAMEEAARQTAGGMVSVLGLDEKQCRSLAKETGATLANLNAPDQFVFSGPPPSLVQLSRRAEAEGAKRVIPLKVGGAFHSALMEPAKRRLGEALKKVTFKGPRCLFVSNVTARGESEPETIRSLLAEQLTSPVRWTETMQYAREQGIDHFIEVGPGRVLRGLARKIDSSLEVFSFEKTEDATRIESMLSQV